MNAAPVVDYQIYAIIDYENLFYASFNFKFAVSKLSLSNLTAKHTGEGRAQQTNCINKHTIYPCDFQVEGIIFNLGFELLNSKFWCLICRQAFPM